MTEINPIDLSPRDRFMQIAREEMAKFEKQELELRNRDRRDRATKLRLPLNFADLH